MSKSQPEAPYQETCSICRATLYSANECYNPRPLATGFCCRSCYNERVKKEAKRLDKEKQN